MSMHTTRFRTTNLSHGAAAVGLGGGVGGTYRVKVKAVKGDVQIGTADSWGFTPLAVSAFTTNSDLDVYTLLEGESEEFVIHDDGTGSLCAACANATGDSVISWLELPI